MKGKGSRLAILLALVLTLVGAFGATAFATSDGHTSWNGPTSTTDWPIVYTCNGNKHSIALKWEGKDEYTYGETVDVKGYCQYYDSIDKTADRQYISLKYKSDVAGSDWTTKVPTDVGRYTVQLRNNILQETFSDGTLNVQDTSVFTIVKADPVVTAPEAKTLVYNGDGQALVKAGKTSVGTMMYQYRVAGTSTWSDWSEDVPVAKNASKYDINWKVELTEEQKKNYNEVNPPGIYVESEIKKADPEYTAPTPKENLVTDGKTELALANKGSSQEGTTMYYSLSEDSGYAPDAVPTEIGPGTYKVWYYVKGNENYNNTEPDYIEATIYEGEITSITWPEAYERDYTGVTKMLLQKPADNAITDADGNVAGHFEYTWEDERITPTSPTNNRPQAKDAGDYVVTVTAVPEEGYTFADSITETSKDIPATIGKAKVTVRWEPVSSDAIIYNYNPDLDGQGPDAFIDGTVTGESLNATVTDNKKVNAGSYTATVKGFTAGDEGTKAGNYEFDESAATKQPFKIVGQPLDVAVEMKDFTYGGEDLEEPVLTGKDADLVNDDPDRFTVLWHYRPTGGEFNDYTDLDSMLDKLATQDVHRYNVQAKIVDKEGFYKTATPYVLFYITQKDITVTADNKYKMYPYYVAYDDFSCTVDGLVNGDEPEDIIASDGVIYKEPEEGSKPELGDHPIVIDSVTLTEEGANNYNLDEKAIEDGNLLIYPGSDNVISIEKNDLTYGEKLGEPTITAKYGKENAVVTYAKKNSEDWIDWDKNETLDAGDYVARLYVHEGSGYTEAYAFDDFTVAKRATTIDLSIGNDVRLYDGKETITDSSKDWVSLDDNVRKKHRGPFRDGITVTPASMKDVGKYELDATYSGKVFRNYDITVIKGSYEITEATMTVTASDGLYTYDGKEHWIDLAVEGPDSDGVVVYYAIGKQLNKDNYKTEGNTDPEKPVNAGKYKIYYYATADNYTPVAGSATLTITKAPVTITVKPLKITTYGTPVEYTEADVTLTNGEGEKIDPSELGGSLKFNYHGYTGKWADVGTYSVTEEGLEANNNYFIVKRVSGNLMVWRKLVKLNWTMDGEDVSSDGIAAVEYDGKDHVVEAYFTYEDSDNIGASDDDLKVYNRDREKLYLKFKNNVESQVKRGDDWSVEEYTATATLASTDGNTASNYALGINSNEATKDFKIAPAELTLTPKAVETIYGEEAKGEGFTAATLMPVDQDGDATTPKKGVIEGTPAYGFTKDDEVYAPGDDVDQDYVVSITNTLNKTAEDALRSNNYDLAVADGTMVVASRPVTMVWSKPDKFTYDAKAHKVEVVDFGEMGLFAGDAKDKTKLNVSYVDNEKTDAGKYNAVASLTGSKANNYVIKGSTQEYPWTIDKATVVVIADDQTIFYGQDYDKSKVSYTGWQGGDSASVLTAVPTVTSTYFVNAKYGTYKLNPSGAAAKNYTFKYDDGVLTVNNKVTTLVAKAAPSGSKATLSWNKVTGAKKYEVYFNKCNSNGKEYSCKKIATVKTNKFKKKGLKKGTCYKFYVVAKDANGKTIAKSKTGHFVAGGYNDSYTNAKSLKVNPSSVSLTSGQSKKLKVSQNKAKSGRILLDGGHAALLRFKSSNTKVATVSSNGVVKAVGKGYCEVYVQATNGMWKKVAVTVK